MNEHQCALLFFFKLDSDWYDKADLKIEKRETRSYLLFREICLEQTEMFVFNSTIQNKQYKTKEN